MAAMRGYNGGMDAAAATYLADIDAGHVWMAVCAVLYLAWWAVFFRPRAVKPHGAERAIGIGLILGAVVCGCAGVACLARGAGGLSHTVDAVLVVLAAFGAYVVLLAFTRALFKRQVTTELLLIVAWAALEWFVLDGAACAGVAVGAPAALVGIAFLFSMVCYVLYYRLHGWTAFFDGCGPLLAVGAISLAFVFLL